MAVHICNHCNFRRLDRTTPCPDCGTIATHTHLGPLLKGLVITGTLFVVFIFVAYLGVITPNPKPSSVRRTGVSPISEYRIVDDGWFGCTEREQLNKLTQYTTQKDKEAFNRELAMGLVTGMCTQFEEGEIVFLMDATVFAGVVNVRRKGETQTYWTYREAIRQ